METLAIFVDAGYVFASCAELLSGRRNEKRHNMLLDHGELIPMLQEIAAVCEPGHRFLRTYWYDAVIVPDRLTEQQKQISQLPNFKLRLGVLNSDFQQKEVDTLIALDMFQLAQRQAISSLVVVTGDTDLRPAVALVQEYGVRVHLVGIQAKNGHNQNERLQREADTVRTLGTVDVLRFFALLNEEGALRISDDDVDTNQATTGPVTIALSSDDAELDDAVIHALEIATTADLEHIIGHSADGYVDVPPAIYRRLLGRYGANLNREISEDEKRKMRHHLLETATRLRQKTN